MAAIAAPSWPPPMTARRRAKPLTKAETTPAENDNDFDVDHIKSETKRAGRKQSRKLLRQAMAETRAEKSCIADALDVDEHGARRALSGRAPFDIGDVLVLAAGLVGDRKLARRYWLLVRDEMDRLDTLAHD